MQAIEHGYSSRSGVGVVPTEGGGEQRTVLLVDPHEDSRFINATMLRYHGYRVLEAKNGAEGILLARVERPDLIVTELFVPSARGWKVPELLKGDPRTARIPILALTAFAFLADEQRAWSAGCDGFLTKPCEPARVVQEVQRLVGAASERS